MFITSLIFGCLCGGTVVCCFIFTLQYGVNRRVVTAGIVCSILGTLNGAIRFEGAGETSNFQVGTSIFAGEISKAENRTANIEDGTSKSEVFASSVSDSGLYHRADCRYEKRMNDKFRMTFDSPEAAEAAGYSQCEWCK